MSKTRIIIDSIAIIAISVMIGLIIGYVLNGCQPAKTNKEVVVNAWCDRIVECKFLPKDQEKICTDEIMLRAKSPNDKEMKEFLAALKSLDCQQFAIVVQKSLQ